MKTAWIKIEKNQDQYQNIVSLSKKKNKLQEIVLKDTVKQSTPEVISQTMPQTVEQARKQYAISSNNVGSQNIIEANDAIAEKVKELNQLEEIHQQLLCKVDSLKIEVMNYMQFHNYLKKVIIFLYRGSTLPAKPLTYQSLKVICQRDIPWTIKALFIFMKYLVILLTCGR